jgi:hypothetical protein
VGSKSTLFASPRAAVCRPLHLRAQGHSIQTVADTIGWSFSQTRRKLQAAVTSEPNEPTIVDIPVETVELAPTSNGTPTSLQRVEIVGEPVTPETSAALRSAAQTHNDLTDLAARVASLEAHRLEVDAHLATLQAHSQETAQPHAALRSAEIRSLAQPSAEPAQTWDDPDDAKSVPFNLSLPRGLKRLLDAEAKRTGFPASRLVQKLLIAALVGEGVHSDG